MSLTQSIIEIAEETAAEHHATKVLSIKLRIGDMSDVVLDSLEFAFEAMTPGTILEGVALEVEWVDALARCQSCGREFHPEPLDFTCPGCGNPFTELVQGKEFAIASIEIDGPEQGQESGTGG
jgi:hydrogenase nickel incorporation protein HypA/HybF